MLLLSLLLALSLLIGKSQLIEFMGDVPLGEHLRSRVCSLRRTAISVLVESIPLLSQKSNSTFIEPYYPCFDLVIPNGTRDALAQLYSLYNFKQLAVYFDFIGQRELLHESRNSAFHPLANTLTELYAQCGNCMPFVFLVGGEMSGQYVEFASRMHAATSTDFRAILAFESNSIHIRPILNGCALYDGIFLPRSRADFDRLRAPYWSCHLDGARLNVSVNHIMPFCGLQFSNEGTIELDPRPSLELEMVRLMQRKFHFNINPIYAYANSANLQTGRVSAIVNQVYNGTSNFGVCDISRALPRLSEVEFSHFTYLDPIIFLTPVPGLQPRNWLIGKPFSYETWLATLASFIALAIAIRKLHQRIMLRSKETPKSCYFIECRLYAILLGQTTKLREWSAHNPIRLLLSIWLLVSLTLNRAYGGVFYSIVTVPQFVRPIDTIQELLTLADHDQMHLIASGVYQRQFITAKPDNQIYYSLGKHVNRTNPEKYRSMSQAIMQLEHSRPHKTPVAIHTRLILSSIIQAFGSQRYHIGSEYVNIDYTGMVLPKKSPLIKPFNMMIVLSQELGFTKKWRRLTYASMSTRKAHQHSGGGAQNPAFDPLHRSSWVLASCDSCSEAHNLSFKDLHSIYYLWSSGLLCSVIAFAVEISLQRLSRSTSSSTSPYANFLPTIAKACDNKPNTIRNSSSEAETKSNCRIPRIDSTRVAAAYTDKPTRRLIKATRERSKCSWNTTWTQSAVARRRSIGPALCRTNYRTLTSGQTRPASALIRPQRKVPLAHKASLTSTTTGSCSSRTKGETTRRATTDDQQLVDALLRTNCQLKVRPLLDLRNRATN